MKFILGLVCLVIGLNAGESTIPEVDMRDFYIPEKRDSFVETVKSALHEYGFFAVTNTGIDQKVIDLAFQRTGEFFSLGKEVKMKYDGARTNYQRGYSFVGKEAAKGAGVSDFKEFLHFGREFDDAKLKELGLWGNLWPEEVNMKYMVDMQHVLALALGEKEEYFDEKTKEGDCLLRAIHYPKIKQSSDKRAVWAAEHTDIDLFTILPRATEAGLEVQLPNGTWHPVHVRDDAFIINAGDFLEIYSNGYFRSSRHRVIAPQNSVDVERYSMVFFVHPTSDTLLYPLSHWTDNKAPKYAAATRLEMLMERLADLGLANDEGLKFLANSGVMERLIAVGRASPDAMRVLKAKGYASQAVLDYLEENGDK